MEATSAPPILLPGIDHLPCLQEIRSVKDKPFYCHSSVGTIPFLMNCPSSMPARNLAVSRTSLSTASFVFLLLAFCKQNASLQQLLSHMARSRVCSGVCPGVCSGVCSEKKKAPARRRLMDRYLCTCRIEKECVKYKSLQQKMHMFSPPIG